MAEIVQIGPGSTDTFVDEALVFQVAAYDPEAGNSDGDGIDEVEMRILRNGQEIYENTEGNVAYCLFEGGEPDCNIWVFSHHNNEWPDGTPVEPGDYTLQAIVKADNGQELTVETEVEIQP
jgi:hypothetical protein